MLTAELTAFRRVWSVYELSRSSPVKVVVAQELETLLNNRLSDHIQDAKVSLSEKGVYWIVSTNYDGVPADGIPS